MHLHYFDADHKFFPDRVAFQFNQRRIFHPMIVTIFRSRLNPGAQEEYGPMARRMSELAKSVPGYISHKGFISEDGERVTVVEFESEEALREWRVHPDHAKAKRRGIESFFSDYKFQICSIIRERTWTAKAKPGVSA
jgi:heme-degrading monooxygenase HmoA